MAWHEKHADFWLLKTACPRATSPPASVGSSVSKCARCLPASAFSSASSSAPASCTVFGYFANSGLSKSTRKPRRPVESFSAATSFKPSASFGDFSNAGKSFGASSGETDFIVSASASCCTSVNFALAKTPAAALRVSTGWLGLTALRRKPKSFASAPARPLGIAARASTRTPVGAFTLRPTWPNASASAACPALGHGRARAVSAAWRTSGGLVSAKTASSSSCQRGGVSLSPAPAMARKASSGASAGSKAWSRTVSASND